MNTLIKAILKKVAKIVYTDGIYPVAKQFVEKTENEWDDKALQFLDEFISAMIDKL